METILIVLLIAGLFLMVVVGVQIYENYAHPMKTTITTISPNKLYQGPVRPTDDEVYFRATGITRSN